MRKKCGSELLNASERNALALLNGERMVCGFEFNKGAPAAVAQMHVGLESKGLRIDRDIIAKPTKEWLALFSRVEIPKLKNAIKTRPRDGNPNTPDERIGAIMNRYFHAPSNEKLFRVDYAQVTVKFSAAAFRFRQIEPRIRRERRET